MKLDYATLLSPFPLVLNNVGGIKSPTLKEIWSPEITYNIYNLYLQFLLMTPRQYCCEINKELENEYNSKDIDEQNALTMFDIISNDENLQKQYASIFDFFFVERVMWDNENKIFITYTNDKENPQIVGAIHKGIYNELCDIILQRCGVAKSEETEPKFKNKIAKKVWLKTHSKTTTKYDKNLELPNLISAYSAFCGNANIVNVWDMTIYQLYDQFKRLRFKKSYDMSSRSISIWGDKDNKFDGDSWYANLN